MIACPCVTHVRPRMGTLLGVVLPRRESSADVRDVNTVFATASAWERVMSHVEPTSTVARLNRLAGRRRGIRSPALAHVLVVAKELARRTDGAFDPTVGPILRVWRRAADRDTVPSPRALAVARGRVDWRAIAVKDASISLRHRGMALDLGAFGKGIALDDVAARLQRRGCPAAFLNFGESSLLAVGGPWPVILRDPRGGFAGEFTLKDQACSTSATDGQCVKIGSRSFGHIIDPRTAQPLPRGAQVVVLARSAAVAEALSTALLVLGRDALESIAREFGAEACWVDGVKTVVTPRFPLRYSPADGV